MKSEYKFGPMRGLGATAGFDWNAKTDAGYNSKKRMLVLGPTAMFDVPGFLNLSLVALWESNALCNTFSNTCTPRYRYKTHPMLTAAWGIPLGASGFSFEGFMNFIAAKGKDEFGGQTKAETNFDGQIMYDVGRLMGSKGMFKVGFEDQYWKNKFGNDASSPAGSVAFGKTPMLRAEGARMTEPARTPLAEGKVFYAGQPVAAIVAETRVQAQDAAELAMVEYHDLPCVVDAKAAVAADAPLVWPDASGNVAAQTEYGDAAKAAEAFAKAAHITQPDLHNQPVIAPALEP